MKSKLLITTLALTFVLPVLAQSEKKPITVESIVAKENLRQTFRSNSQTPVLRGQIGQEKLNSDASKNPAQISRGNEGGGGGCAVPTLDGLLLKDFIRAGVSQTQLGSLAPGTGLQPSPIAQTLGFEVLNGQYGTMNFKDTLAFRKALEKLNMWRADSPYMTELLIQSLSRVRFLSTEVLFKPIAYGCYDRNNYPIVVYSADYMAALISLPVWNQLALESQIGAIYKEALRFLQSELNIEIFEGEGLSENSEKLLSEIVSTLVFGSPVPQQESLAAIFHRYGKKLNVATLSKLNQDYQSICQKFIQEFYALPGSSHSKYQTLSVASRCQLKLSEDRFEEEIEQMVTALNDIQYLEALYHSEYGFDTSKGFDRIMSAVSQFFRVVITERITRSVRSPKNKAALKQLSEITTSLESCARTMQGNSCQSTGWMNVEEISKAIYYGYPLTANMRAAIDNSNKYIQSLLRTDSNSP